MNFQDLLSKISALDQPVGESMQPPVQAVMATASGPATPEVTGDSGHLELDEKGAMECGPEMMAMAPKQPDNVDMNVTMHGQGPNGIRSLMDILRSLDKSADEPQHGDDHMLVGVETTEPQHDEPEEDKLFGSVEEAGKDGEYGNRPDPEIADIANVLPKGSDLLGSRRKEPPKPAGGGNPYPMNETLVAKLQAHYDSIKEDAGGPINPNAKCNICHTPYAKHFRFDPPGDPTGKRTSTLIRSICGAVPQNFPDLYSMSESDKKTMSRAAKGNEKYGKDGMKALAKAGREGKSLEPIKDKYNKYDESSINEWGVNLSQPSSLFGGDAPKAYDDEANVTAMTAKYDSLIDQTRQEIARLEADPTIGGQPKALAMAKEQLDGLRNEKLHNLTGTGSADATNALRKQAIANNELTPGQWLQKATQYFKGKVTGQPQPGVSYDRIDTTKHGTQGYSTSTPYKPGTVDEGSDLSAMLKIAGLR